jgi:hypothetical protein
VPSPSLPSRVSSPTAASVRLTRTRAAAIPTNGSVAVGLNAARSVPGPRVVTTPHVANPADGLGINIALIAALITVRDQEPKVLLLDAATVGGFSRADGLGQLDGDGPEVPRLPAGPLLPREHASLEHGVRALVAAQVGIYLGHTEQLYTFGKQGRVTGASDETSVPASPAAPHTVSIGYLSVLATTHEDATQDAADAGRWVKCYDILPWEDWRAGRPAILDTVIKTQLDIWVERPDQAMSGSDAMAPTTSRRSRVDLAFGFNGGTWDEERVLERHELLYDAGMLSESRRESGESSRVGQPLGLPLVFDHRRTLAMALGRLRAKLKYRPIAFDLMDDTFTLYELQCTVQAILGTPLHKQNFRRLVETTRLVEEVGEIRARTGGRPAKLYRFRPHVVLERSAPGVRIKSMRT